MGPEVQRTPPGPGPNLLGRFDPVSTSTARPRRVKPKPPRSVLLSGPVLLLKVGEERTVYEFERLPADFGLAAALTKAEAVRTDAGLEIRPGQRYHVLVNSADGRHSCECKGFLRWGHCKHTEALALVAAGKLQPLAPMSPAVPA